MKKARRRLMATLCMLCALPPATVPAEAPAFEHMFAGIPFGANERDCCVLMDLAFGARMTAHRAERVIRVQVQDPHTLVWMDAPLSVLAYPEEGSLLIEREATDEVSLLVNNPEAIDWYGPAEEVELTLQADGLIMVDIRYGSALTPDEAIPAFKALLAALETDLGPPTDAYMIAFDAYPDRYHYAMPEQDGRPDLDTAIAIVLAHHDTMGAHLDFANATATLYRWPQHGESRCGVSLGYLDPALPVDNGERIP